MSETMTKPRQLVFIALQANNDTMPIIAAIVEDNPEAKVNEYPAMVKIDCPGKLTIRRETIENHVGRSFDLREIQINLISLSGELDETEDEFVLEWKTA